MTLLEKIRTKTARVGIIGQGYVGLPLALVFDEAGFPRPRLRRRRRKVDALDAGKSYIRHIGSDRVAKADHAAAASGATTDFDGWRSATRS